jgi:hypothetical protein
MAVLAVEETWALLAQQTLAVAAVARIHLLLQEPLAVAV